jgi:hypothetical protein
VTLPALPRRPNGLTHQLADEYVRAACELYGLGFMHIRDSRRSPAVGWPDYVIVGTRILYREYKSPGDTLRPAQREWRNRIRAAGGDWGLWTAEWLHGGMVAAELQALR